MSDSEDRPQELQRWQRARLLHSIRDFQIAQSAATLLAEYDPEEGHPPIEKMRRFRCYETTMIVAYARPFSSSRGKIAPLTLRLARAKLTDEQKGLHKRLLVVRNKVTAHSDLDTMRALSEAEPIALRDDFIHAAFRSVFDERPEFIGPTLQKTRRLIETVHGSVFRRLFETPEPPDDLIDPQS